MVNPVQTIEELEGDVWGEPDFDSHLVTTCHRLRKKPIGQFTIENLRIMIGQNIGTQYLMPRVLDELESDPFAEGDFYPGDLLQALIKLPHDYWREHGDHHRRALSAASRALDQMRAFREEEPYTSDKSLIERIQRFLERP